MRLNMILMTAAMVGVAALPAAAQSQSVQQRLNEEHAEWHRNHDADAYRNPAKYQREHQEEHSKLDQQYARWQRQVGSTYGRGNYGYNQYPYGYGQQYPYGYPQQYPQSGGWYDQYGRWHPNQQQQNGYYDQYGRWHPYQQQQNGYYDQYGRWHPYTNGNYQRRDDDDRGRGNNPKAEGRHDNGKHKGWDKNGKDRDDDDRD